MFTSSTRGYTSEWITLDNTEVQDVFITCESYISRMFPYGLGDCKEKPTYFLFKIYSKFGNTNADRIVYNPE
jgi:hypothetical protein